MANVRWAKGGLAAILGLAAPTFGCSSSTTNDCAAITPTDASLMEMRPRAETGSDAPVTVNGALGSSCASEADCQSGLNCIRSTDDLQPGAGPSNGLCTKSCTPDANNSVCKPLGGSCIFFDANASTGVCVETCTLGATATAKCHNRPDVACESISNAAGMVVLNACIPLCTDDADCGTRECDLGTGYCADRPSPGAPPGGACSKDDDCQSGSCLPVSDEDAGGPRAGACISYCRYGGLEGCGFRRGALMPGSGACAIAQARDGADGDEGFCLGLCDTDADCPVKTPGWGCVNIAEIRSIWGHGVCFFNQGVAQVDAGTAPDAARSDAASEAAALDAARSDAASEAAAADADASARSADAGADATVE